MKCINCGYEIPDDALFCQNCGKKVSVDKLIAKKVVDLPNNSGICGSTIFFDVLGIILIIFSFLCPAISYSSSGMYMVVFMITFLVSAIIFFCLGSIAQKNHIIYMKVNELYDVHKKTNQ